MSYSKITQANAAGPAPFRFRFDFDIAFQAIIDMRQREVWAYEALVRGPNGQSAAEVIAGIPAPAMYAADQHCRETAIALASSLGMTEYLSVNFLRGALLAPQDYIASTLDCAAKNGFPTDRIMLEFSETEQVEDIFEGRRAVNQHAARGFLTAMDDFGAGYQGLSLLCDVQPDVIKMDMSMVRGVDTDPRRAKIVSAIVQLCRELDVMPVCEGVETKQELDCLLEIGVAHFQGFLLARPQLGRLLDHQQKEAAFAHVAPPLRPAG